MQKFDPSLIRASVNRGGLLEFMSWFWDTVESCDFVVEPHIQQICNHLQAAALHGTKSLRPKLDHLAWAKQDIYQTEEVCNNLVISIPPGMSKSVTCSVFWPIWCWTWCPAAKFICTSYADDLALREARRGFDLMGSEKFRAAWPELHIVDGERAAMANYQNNFKGVRYSLPMGGKITGKHGHFLMSDDPIKPDDLKLGGDSARGALDQVKHRWDALFSNRSAHAPTFTRVVIAQRLHTEDLSGHFIKQGAHELRLPMTYEPHAHCTTPWGGDWREEADELLAPIRFPQTVIDMRKGITPARDWAAQAQQRPSPEDGSSFQRAWFQHRYVGMPWGNVGLTMSVDASNKKEGKGRAKADYTAITVWAKDGPRSYLVDIIQARMGFNDQLIAIAALRNKWANIRNTLVESKANGEAIVDTLKRKFPGVISVDPLGGKEARASSTEWVWAAGNVYLPERHALVDAFIDEHILFPVGSTDDMVDSASMFLNWAYSKDRKQLLAKAMANANNRFLTGGGNHW